jgi:hypothetical protein
MNLRLRRVELHNLAGVLVHSVVAYQTVLGALHSRPASKFGVPFTVEEVAPQHA